jgi:diguanylate cyclase (GGDEF)-like protein/PAS domain S-box-containing protein
MICQPHYNVPDSVEAMLGYWDLELRCRYANSAYNVWFGRSKDDMLGIRMQELLGPLFELNLPHIVGAIQGETQQFERWITLPDGTQRHALASYYPDFSDGTMRGFNVHVADVTPIKLRELELEQARARAEERATHDFLTGLPNRVNLLNRIEEAIEQAAGNGCLAAVVVIDLDDFKVINDTYGHPLGDVVLKTVAERMTSGLREGQRVKRYGGDEFVLIVPNVRAQIGVAQMVRRMQTVVCRPLLVDGVPIRLRLSCGIALFPVDGSNAQDLLYRADRALYEAKKNGSGQIAFATPAMGLEPGASNLVP